MLWSRWLVLLGSLIVALLFIGPLMPPAAPPVSGAAAVIPTSTSTATVTGTATATATVTATATATRTPTATSTPTGGRGPLGNLAFIQPVRVVDTRGTAPGPIGFQANGLPIAAGQLTNGSVTRFKIAGQTFGGTAIPADATGVLINVTVVQGVAGGGFVTVYPGDAASPPNASTVNPATSIAANFWTVGLAPAGGPTGGTIAVASVADPRDLVIDLVGFYSPSNPVLPAGPGNLTFVAPVRVLDTRPTNGPAGITTTGFDQNGNAITAGPLAANTVRRFTLAGKTFGTAGTNQLTFPSDVGGIIAHITTIQGSASGGFTTLLPGNFSGTTPSVSSVNPSTAIAFNSWVTGLPTSGGAAAGQGQFAVYATNSQDVAIDVVGYYAPSAPNSVGTLNLITPVRAVDTRSAPPAPIGFQPGGAPITAGQIGAGQTRRYQLAGQTFAGTPIPADATGVLANVTIVQNSASGGFVTAFPGTVATAPNASTVNPSTAIAASFWANGLGLAPAANAGTEAIFSTNQLDVIVDIVGYYQPPANTHAIKNVFVILMENHNWADIKGSASAPYINGTLLPRASRAEQYFNPPALHPSEPNYLWLEAGTNCFADIGCITDDADPSAHSTNSAAHLTAQLNAAGINWKSYNESAPAGCPLTSVYPYTARHNPFVFFKDNTGNNDPASAFCTAHVRPLTDLTGDLAAGTVGRYNFITPNVCSDMHDVCAPTSNAIKQGDDFLAATVPGILSSTAYQQGGAIFITWDEGAGGSDGPIGMIVLSSLAKGGGYSNTIPYTHSSTVRTMQEIFGVGPLLGGAGAATNLSDLFTSYP